MSITNYLPAPTETPEIIREAATKIANNIRYIDDKETLIESLIYAWNNCSDTDGYHLARILDDDCNYTIDSIFIDDLDSMQWEVDRLIHQARTDWIKENNIVPELEIGTLLNNIPKGPGVITGVCEYSSGYYLVKRDCDNNNSRLLVKFEDAILKG